jgi:hypothetical protein
MELNAAQRWLQGFPARHHGLVHAWFLATVQQGASTPEEMVIKVTVLIGQKQSWSVVPESRRLCANALTALRCDLAGALAYAASFLEERRDG